MSIKNFWIYLLITFLTFAAWKSFKTYKTNQFFVKIDCIFLNQSGENINYNFEKKALTFSMQENIVGRRYYSSVSYPKLNRFSGNFEIFIPKKSILDSLTYVLYINSKSIEEITAFYEKISPEKEGQIESVISDSVIENDGKKYVLKIEI